MEKTRRNGLIIMASLLKLLGKLAYIIIFAVFGGYLGNLCAISVMVFGAFAVSELINVGVTSSLLPLFITLTIVAGVLRGLLRFLEQYNNHFIAFKLLAALRDKIFTALRRLCPAKLEGKEKGNIIAMLTSDVETLEVFYAHTISPICIAVLIELTIVIFTSIYASIYFGLIYLVASLIIGIVIPFTASSLLKKDGNDYRKTFADTSTYFLDAVKGVSEIIMNHNEAYVENHLNENSKILNSKTKNIKEKSSVTGSLSQLIVSLTIIVTMLVGALLVINGSLSLGHMIVGAIAIFSSFGPVLALANLPSNLTQTFASGERILSLMEEDPVVEENQNGQEFDFKNLTIEGVSFAYNNKPVLNDVSLKINQGDIVGLIGASGCGKSTLLKLMLRFYDANKGSVKYNSIDIKNISAASLKHNVTMVSQDTYLFNDTIYNNLIFVKPNATKEEVREACKKASIDDFIMNLDDGYDSEVGLLGDALSAGEKQRLGLARAFLSGSKVILLDEVTSNVDAINEGIILQSLKEIAQDKTIILVSHRESTTSICNKKYYFNEGKIA